MTNVPSRRNKRLPANEAMRMLAAQGYGCREIAQRYGAQTGTVQQRFSAMHLRVPLETRRAEPAGLRKIIRQTADGPVSLPAVSIQEFSS